jgi:transitional endoplasmic reticulum ATPase
MPLTVEIRFGKSTSKSYPKALTLIKKFSNVAVATDDCQENSVMLSEKEFIEKQRRVTDLWALVSNWKSTRVLVNGESVEFADLEQFSNVLRCYQRYTTAVFQEGHCDKRGSERGWGCLFLQAVNPDLPSNSWTQDRYWYEFGSFSPQNVWQVDKDRLRGAIGREIELRRVSFCPAFNRSRVDAVFAALPDQIDPAADEAWRVTYESSADGTVAERRPIGIQPAIKNAERISISLGAAGGTQTKSGQDGQPESRNIPEVTFADIGGIDDIIQTVREIIELPIKKPEIFKYLGIRAHKGILLYGLPGSGKTLIAKAIANEIRAHFITIAGPELVSKWHGQSEENLRAVFEEAKRLQPSIIYFDEIDSMAQSRSSDEASRIDAPLVNQLLTLMDGVEDYGNVRVIASTNRPELIDSALVRPGRFDFSIEVKRPTLEGCYQIFAIQTKKMPIDSAFDQRRFSTSLLGLSGAEIAFVAREGAYNCLRRNVDLRRAIADDELEKIEYDSLVVTRDDFARALAALKQSKSEPHLHPDRLGSMPA